MREDVLSRLACPSCRDSLSLVREHASFELDSRKHTVEGVLACSGDHLFPIIDEVPRLLPERLFSADERNFLAMRAESPAASKRDAVTPEVLSPPEIERRIRKHVETAYGLAVDSPQEQRVRVESAVEYMIAEYRGDNKQKYVDLLKRDVTSANSLLDVGGGVPGLLRCLSAQYQPDLALMVDLDASYHFAFKDSTRDIGFVRADAQALPLAPGSFDLVVSAFTLEHIPDWRRALKGMLASGGVVFAAFGPNRWFPFEIGHLDAPLAGTLPKGLAAYVAYGWLSLVGRKKPMELIRKILAETFHLSSREFRVECRALGVEPRNVFHELVRLVSQDRSAPPTPSRRVIRTFPGTATFLARTLSSLGLEPQMYYLLTVGGSARLPEESGDLPPV